MKEGVFFSSNKYELSIKKYSKIPKNIPNADIKAQIISPYKIFSLCEECEQGNDQDLNKK